MGIVTISQQLEILLANQSAPIAYTKRIRPLSAANNPKNIILSRGRR